jgi:hypothetical protein
LKSDEKKSKHAGLAQENGFCSCKYSQFAEAGEWHSKSCEPAREECNKYDLTTVPYFLLANHKDWSR